jgi:hypothetical protein
MSEIKFHESWTPEDKRKLEDLFAQARREKKWLHYNGLAGEVWFSPDELKSEQRNGKFVWSAENWKLVDPFEKLLSLQRGIISAQAACANFNMRLEKWAASL